MRMVLGFDLGRIPEGWIVDEVKENDESDDETQEERLWRIMGGIPRSLYAWNADVGICYENILAQILEMTRRSELYHHLEMDAPLTGQPNIGNDEFCDDFQPR